MDLLNENRSLAKNMCDKHQIADEVNDMVMARLLKVYIDKAERCFWFLF